MLFAVEAGPHTIATVLRDFWREFPGDPEGRDYAKELLEGVHRELEALDGHIRQASANWRLERMSRVDRNVLRLATFELVNQRDTPKAVILDEAVELAKRYGNESSGPFVNGVLSEVAALVRPDEALEAKE
jgi:N utilization substance protein B